MDSAGVAVVSGIIASAFVAGRKCQCSNEDHRHFMRQAYMWPQSEKICVRIVISRYPFV
jgi:hypothetical protein